MSKHVDVFPVSATLAQCARSHWLKLIMVNVPRAGISILTFNGKDVTIFTASISLKEWPLL